MILPTEKTIASINNPRFVCFFGRPKSGKTLIAAALPNNLIIDMEDGSNYVSALVVKAKSVEDLKEIAAAIKEAGCPYDYITLDTATALEDMTLPMALQMYRATPMGKDYGKNPKTGQLEYVDVRMLPNGGGFLYIREAFKKVIMIFKNLTPTLILLGHTKDRTINRDGKDLSENLLDLSGKLERLIASQVDALGYVYRDKNKTIINFKGGDDFIVEARPAHLRGKEIVIAESDEDGVITTYWERIFK